MSYGSLFIYALFLLNLCMNVESGQLITCALHNLAFFFFFWGCVDVPIIFH